MSAESSSDDEVVRSLSSHDSFSMLSPIFEELIGQGLLHSHRGRIAPGHTSGVGRKRGDIASLPATLGDYTLVKTGSSVVEWQVAIVRYILNPFSGMKCRRNHTFWVAARGLRMHHLMVTKSTSASRGC